MVFQADVVTNIGMPRVARSVGGVSALVASGWGACFLSWREQVVVSCAASWLAMGVCSVRAFGAAGWVVRCSVLHERGGRFKQSVVRRYLCGGVLVLVSGVLLMVGGVRQGGRWLPRRMRLRLCVSCQWP